jgi:hypothetical protein
MSNSSSCYEIFISCVEAIQNGELIESISQKDKEFHFQNWFQKRLENNSIFFESSGRNTYPDFRLVNIPEGYEVKGLAWPGREKDYDCNSQVPSGKHNGREIFYVFGRYPADLSGYLVNGKREYPVIDLLICHGDFLNADHEYLHKNKSVKGFGSYGDIMIRDRKMYVAPTPFALAEGTTGLCTLILPTSYKPDQRFVSVGSLNRIEGKELVVGYNFDLTSNVLNAQKVPNPNAGHEHKFIAYRLKSQSDKPVKLLSSSKLNEIKEEIADDAE